MAAVSGCGVKQEQKEMYSSDKAIAKSGDVYTYGDRTGDVTTETADVGFTKFYGSDTIWTIEAGQESGLTLQVQQALSHGKFKIVLVTPDGNIVVVKEGSGEGEFKLQLAEGRNAIKFVGSNAKGTVQIQLESSGNLPIAVVNSGGS
ncbi:hypothetical protein KC345_g11107 [Hortaea werneckii]|nr:hypothetical protein KC345_g11107 [Hortaea werneckii]